MEKGEKARNEQFLLLPQYLQKTCMYGRHVKKPGLVWQRVKSHHFYMILLSALQDINPFPNDKILDSPKMKEFAEDNFKFDQNGTNFSKWVEYTAGKVEIASLQANFYFFNRGFKRLVLQTGKNQGLFGKGLKQKLYRKCDLILLPAL